MRTHYPEKLLDLIDDLAEKGSLPLERLAFLEKWFLPEERIGRLGLWIARRSAARKGKTKGEPGALLDEARALLGKESTYEDYFARPERHAAEELLARSKTTLGASSPLDDPFGSKITCRPLWLVEQALEVYLGYKNTPQDAVTLLMKWACDSKTKPSPSLADASIGKLDELLSFMHTVEALEYINPPR